MIVEGYNLTTNEKIIEFKVTDGFTDDGKIQLIQFEA